MVGSLGLAGMRALFCRERGWSPAWPSPDALLPIQLRPWTVFTLPTAVKVIGNPFVLLLVATDRTVIHFDEGELHDALCEVPFTVVHRSGRDYSRITSSHLIEGPEKVMTESLACFMVKLAQRAF